MRFKWIGDEMLRVINEDGIEKLVDIGTEFSQVAFNKIDNYNHSKDRETHFYYNREPLMTD